MTEKLTKDQIKDLRAKAEYARDAEENDFIDVQDALEAFEDAANPDAVLALLDELEKAHKALIGMLNHSCVADAGADMKDDEDHAAERAAMDCLKGI